AMLSTPDHFARSGLASPRARLDLLVQAEQTEVSLGALYRGVFLDRDGTINEEVGYLRRLDQFRFIDGAAEAVKLLNESGLKVVIVTNQAGVARGYLSEQALQQIHCVMAEALRAQYARLDGIYYCPHHPIEGVGAYKIECDCRKPKPGMMERAARELNIDLSRSFIVGDKITDLETGYVVGCKTVLVRTGYGLTSEEQFVDRPFQPDYVADNVLEASRWILKQAVGAGA
ncbi:MAG: D-glycero-beta-D-manno-heptose 1,7-bisphosphate 7-phosphatase, partial [Anaerolineae bacterium]